MTFDCLEITGRQHNCWPCWAVYTYVVALLPQPYTKDALSLVIGSNDVGGQVQRQYFAVYVNTLIYIVVSYKQMC